MKTLNLALLCLALAACGSEDKKPAAAAAAKPILVPIEGQKEGVVCPTLTGKYAPKDSEDGVEFSTKVENGVFSYSISPGLPLQKADGKPVRYEGKDASESGAMAFSCDAESVTLVLQIDSEPAPIKIRYLPVGDEIHGEVKTKDGETAVIVFVRK